MPFGPVAENSNGLTTVEFHWFQNSNLTYTLYGLFVGVIDLAQEIQNLTVPKELFSPKCAQPV